MDFDQENTRVNGVAIDDLEIDPVVYCPWKTLITSIQWPNVDDLNTKLFFLIKQKLADNPQSFNEASKANLYLDFDHFPERDQLAKMFLQSFKLAYKQYGRELPEAEEVNVADCWLNYDEQGAGSNLHNHTDSIFTSVYYVSASPEQGVMKLYDPRWSGLDFPHVGRHEFIVKPQPGLMVVFPTNVWHEVKAFQPTFPRISIVSNYRLVQERRNRYFNK